MIRSHLNRIEAGVKRVKAEAEVDLGSADWHPVMVGPAVVGWAGPYKSPYWTRRANITILMGDRRFTLDTKIMDNLPEQQNYVEEWIVAREMLTYDRFFAATIPEGSLDITDSGEIAYTPRSIENLYTVLTKFFDALLAEMQANLHNLSPVEVVRKFAELGFHNFPSILSDNFMWRGRKLNDIPLGSKIQARAVTVGIPARYPYIQLPKYPSFSTVVEWQTRASFNPDRILPHNVFSVRTTSPEEYELVEQWFNIPDLLARYLAKVSPKEEGPNATFVICPTGDPLEEWIDGKTLSVKKFARAMAKLGASERTMKKIQRNSALKDGNPMR